jgi:diketogulonate reductase-like aldo/keto reductase
MSHALSIETKVPLLNSDVRIPQLGFGVYQSSEDKCKASCLAALKAGYRHIDTAQFYANEKQVGQALKESGLSRSDVFVTTKILAAGATPEKTYKKCLDSVSLIDGEDGYIDLFLIHSPHSGPAKVQEMWQALERLQSEGRVKSIGVSNFSKDHIEAMKGYATVWPPPVNQIEVGRRRYSLSCTAQILTRNSYILGVGRVPRSNIARRLA